MILLDVFCVVVILFFLIRGLLKGLLNSVFWLAGLLCAGFIAYILYRPVGSAVAAAIGFGPTLVPLLAFLIMFFLITGVFAFVGKMTTRAAQTLRLSIVNRLLGAGFGTGIGVLVSGVVVFMIRSALDQVGKASAIDQTIVARPVMDLAVAILGVFTA